MRLFLAIFPPAEVREYIRDVLRQLDKEKRNIRPINIENVHLTLKFFGAKVNESSRQKIAKQLLSHAGSFPKPEIEVGAVQLGFHRQKYPRVLLLDVPNSDELDDLTNFVHRTSRELKLRDIIKWKQKDFHDHHISIARLKEAAVNASTIRRVKQVVKQVDVPLPEAFTPDVMYLMKSEITKRGPVYSRLEQIKL